jgi:hypothetical protein
MWDSLSIGPVPSDETCQQVGTADYNPIAALAECHRFANLLKKIFPLVEGVRYHIANNPHDFGNYYDVEILYDSSNAAAVDYAYRVEANTPETWDEAEASVRINFVEKEN